MKFELWSEQSFHKLGQPSLGLLLFYVEVNTNEKYGRQGPTDCLKAYKQKSLIFSRNLGLYKSFNGDADGTVLFFGT